MPIHEPTHGHILLISTLESLFSFYYIPEVFPVNSTATRIFLIFASINWGLWLTWKLIIYPFLFSPFRHLPKPKTWGYPLIGHGHVMFSRPPGEAYLKMMKEVSNDGMIHLRSFFHTDRLVLTEPATLAEVLVHKSYDFEKPSWARIFLRQFLGDGLLMTEGDEHKHQRKHIMPSFSFRHIKELYPVFWKKSLELCRTVATELKDNSNDAGSDVLEMNHFSTEVTMDIIGLAGLGRDIQALKNSDDELVKNYEEILEPTTEKAVYFVLHTIFPQWFIQILPWSINQRVKVTTRNLKNICTQFVREKKERMKTEDDKHIDILSILIRSNDFSDEGLVDQLLTFLAAGHETTSSAFTWATHLLAVHPEIQTRLRTEIHNNIPTQSALDDSPDISSLLESLPYLNAVCNETLRLFPTIPVTSRVSCRDTFIRDQYVPKGTVSFIVPWAVNRNPKLWGADAEEFNPSRWIDPDTGRANNVGSAKSNYSFLSFLHGPRSCIGERFARGELRALVAAFVGSFEMAMADPEEQVIPAGTITSKPKNGMNLRLRPVEW
ncbi:cytochrome P450 3A4 [Delitschia confertaspora ATCC 74209]|uniref:Cytochrome P450 3A4 n=1 Tax=Delitschia confertaspora ATCC 74209 TaxID=1513339 RepID=A0A9P4JLN8_9PLEO|nr:cytochrome P450 3A4 [Delitschia confertaspora ATCC 74209]